MPMIQVMVYLDCGTIYDSSGGHVDIWCATVVWINGKMEEESSHVALFYDKVRAAGETNKNANTGMMCLRELVNIYSPPFLLLAHRP